jgi:hypothetical protein
MGILHKSGNQPALEDHDPADEWTGFMRMRKPQKRDGLTELLSDQRRQAEYRREIDSLIGGLVHLLPKRDAVGLSGSALNGFALPLAFLISATSRAMARTRRSVSWWSNKKLTNTDHSAFLMETAK